FFTQVNRVKRHLEPLAIAANATQSNCARLDVVLVTLVILYHKFCDSTLDPSICDAARKSLEKRWKKADQDIFLLAVILNPYLRVSCFSERSPYRNFSNVWRLCQKVFLRLYATEPNLEFRSTLQEYVSEIGGWSALDMGLDQYTEQAKREDQNVNLIHIWWNMDQIRIGLHDMRSLTNNGRSGFIRLAIHILSIVPNSAATERLFSQFGIIHLKLRNRLSVEKVRKQALVRSDTITRHGFLRGAKRKFIEIDEDDAPPQNSNSHTSIACSTAT
ncbi:hypothetical protein SCLCIDRAFT_70236, partial [Scleroderma citrinum Foug A]